MSECGSDYYERERVPILGKDDSENGFQIVDVDRTPLSLVMTPMVFSFRKTARHAISLKSSLGCGFTVSSWSIGTAYLLESSARWTFSRPL